MRVAVTGGRGFLGSYLAGALDPSFEWLFLSRRPASVAARDTGPNVVSTDYSVNDLRERIAGVDALVHMAAARHQPGAPMHEYLSNIEVSANVFDACRAAGVSNIVHLSTIGVYGVNPEQPWRESQPTSPVTFYAVSKVAVEQLAGCYAPQGLCIKHLRVAQVIGNAERPGFMLSVFLEKARSKQTLSLWGQGRGRREYIYAKDVAGAVAAALAKPEASGLFNVGAGCNVSHRELAEAVNQAWDNSGNIDLLTEKKEDLSSHLMDSSKAQAELGWAARWSLAGALQDMRKDLENPGGNERL